jgi:hypothetical protein
MRILSKIQFRPYTDYSENKGYSDVLGTSELSALIKNHYDNLSR